MIELFIFHLHLVGALYAFTKNWQTRGIKDGILAVLVVGLFFTIGWALTGSVSRIIMPYKWNTTYFTQDTLSLVMLLVPEVIFFYYFFYRDKGEKIEKVHF